MKTVLMQLLFTALCLLVIAGCDPVTTYFVQNHSGSESVFVREGDSRAFTEVKPGITQRLFGINRSSRFAIEFKFGQKGKVMRQMFEYGALKQVESTGAATIGLWPGDPPKVVVTPRIR